MDHPPVQIISANQMVGKIIEERKAGTGKFRLKI